jgi:uncharacterized protein (TIGR02453 family)
MAGQAHFNRAFFQFLDELKANNNRDWFHANKDRFQHQVQEPLLRFISDFSDPLRVVSRNFVADPRPTGGSMFRIYRDVRFAKDKSPYKTHAAAQFRHAAGRDVHAPGFYLHLEPSSVFVGAGLWHPERTVLDQIRTAIAEHPQKWTNAITKPEFTSRHQLAGESLKRPPRGYDPEHRLIEDIKRKDFICVENFSKTAACKPDFIDRVAESFQAASPLMRFLTEAVGLKY